jgi:Methane oxygenase PmoA
MRCGFIAKLGTGIVVTSICCGALASDQSAQKGAGVQITQLTNRLRIEINGKLFTEYYFSEEAPRPYYYPVLGPDQLAMTRNWPMKSPPDEERIAQPYDHPHHRSLWYGHILVNGQDFWDEQKKFGRIVHKGFDRIESGADSGVIKSHDWWVAPNGDTVCTDNRTFRIYNTGNAKERLFDFEITLHAGKSDLTFGDNKDGTMAIRVAETMRLKGPKGKPGLGHIVTSTGARDDDTWGKRADWCDYYGPVEGKTVGIAIFDHPQNPRHPTWWHVRDYGLFAANPFGKHDFEKLEDKSAGNLTVPAGQSITFRYRFYIHEGNEKDAKVAEKYADYATKSPN